MPDMRSAMNIVPRISWLALAKVPAVLSLVVAGSLCGSGQWLSASAQAQPSQQKITKGEKARPRSPMERCIASWDRATQMSKQEWRETCKRTVKENPDLYGRPF
jgi:hypothetical protein